jgi:death on curing protein
MMINKVEILRLHDLSIINYGGSYGVRDESLLESAIGRPFQTFDGIDLYEDIYQKAAAIGESIIINHPFIDGNKRTGLLAMGFILFTEGIIIIAKEEDLYNMIIQISTGHLKFDETVDWLKANSAEINL